MDELGKLIDYCRSLGATQNQAEIMARQLLKRAEQLGIARKLTREEAMDYLLRIVAQGRTGEVPKEFQQPGKRP